MQLDSQDSEEEEETGVEELPRSRSQRGKAVVIESSSEDGKEEGEESEEGEEGEEEEESEEEEEGEEEETGLEELSRSWSQREDGEEEEEGMRIANSSLRKPRETSTESTKSKLQQFVFRCSQHQREAEGTNVTMSTTPSGDNEKRATTFSTRDAGGKTLESPGVDQRTTSLKPDQPVDQDCHATEQELHIHHHPAHSQEISKEENRVSREPPLAKPDQPVDLEELERNFREASGDLNSDEEEGYSPRQQRAILEFLNGCSSEEDVCSIPGCSSAKARHIFSHRPFDNWESLVSQVA